MRRRFSYLPVATAFVLIAGRLAAQSYDEYIDISLYGYLDQYSMNAAHTFHLDAHRHGTVSLRHPGPEKNRPSGLIRPKKFSQTRNTGPFLP